LHLRARMFVYVYHRECVCMSLHVCVYVFKQSFLGLFVVDVVDVCARESVCEREMYTYVPWCGVDACKNRGAHVLLMCSYHLAPT